MLTHLSLSGFRNLAPLELELEAGPSLVLGDNGAGKTSLLEAIYVLATTRSFRSRELADCLAHGGAAFAIRGEFAGVARTRLSLDWRRNGLERAVNGHGATLRAHLDVQAVLAWTAADGPLWAGPAEDRRRFLDRGMVAIRPADLELLSRYREALRQKRLWLLQAAGPSVRQRQELASWNEVLASAGFRLASRRRALVAELQQTVAQLMAELALDLEVPELVLRSSPAEPLASAADLYAALEAAAAEEIRLQRARVGPHRDDLEVLWRARRARAQASAGERKAIGLLLVAAQARLCAAAGRPAILLLDDVDAELDRHRLQALWPVLAAGPQVLASSSRPEVFSGIAEPARQQLEGGRVITR